MQFSDQLHVSIFFGCAACLCLLTNVYFYFSLSKQVAPLAISDASMLAPEEVYKSAGLVKGESELTPEERKRRRAQKKRKRKGPICHLELFFITVSMPVLWMDLLILSNISSIISEGKIALALLCQSLCMIALELK